jgi:hypothetical protein
MKFPNFIFYFLFICDAERRDMQAPCIYISMYLSIYLCTGTVYLSIYLSYLSPCIYISYLSDLSIHATCCVQYTACARE